MLMSTLQTQKIFDIYAGSLERINLDENDANKMDDRKEFEKAEHRSTGPSTFNIEVEEKMRENTRNGDKLNAPWLEPCPHGELDIDELSTLEFKNRRVVAIHGLPGWITKDILRLYHWYGQFKGMKKIHINKNKPRAMDETDSVVAFITFDNEKSVQDAIDSSNSATFEGGRTLKAAFGIKHYCRNFLFKRRCKIPQCRCQHKWVTDSSDLITASERRKFKGVLKIRQIPMLFINLHLCHLCGNEVLILNVQQTQTT